MAGFRFNFQLDGDDGDVVMDATPAPSASTDESKAATIHDTAAPPMIPCQVVQPTEDVMAAAAASVAAARTITITPTTKVKQCPNLCRAKSELAAVVSATDVLPGVYEGGYELWECARDLMVILAEQTVTKLGSGIRVLEIGCGNGLPGILCGALGADVVLADLNQEVLEDTALPNMIANLGPDCCSRVQLVSGDWRGLQPVLNSLPGGGLFDVILMSETIYNPASYEPLIAIMKHHMKPTTGITLVAAKRYYFGVGGGVRDFEAHVARSGLAHSVVRVFEDGASNIREVIQVAWG